ncbi:hypothetical protein DAMA08_021320 [Martiniozyma asiatica (nom. inval.)]|nr:hypothetical protein DAMA08_021320 [Martiniozyma asiatica]
MLARSLFRTGQLNLLKLPHQNSFTVGLQVKKFSVQSQRFNVVKSTMDKPPASNIKKPLDFLRLAVKYFYAGCGLVTGTIVIGIAGFFIYDYTTYSPPPVPGNLMIQAEALNPPIGGPENLPILYKSIDTNGIDGEKSKPKLVILGSGWGAVSILRQLDSEDYDVTVISPTNYFLFTPMLPCAAVGTLEIKSLMENIRSLVGNVNGHFLQAAAEKVLFSDKLIKVKDVKSENYFYVPYDKIVVAVGSISNTHGVKGLQHTNQLKTAEDALAIRRKILHNFEKACLPTTTDEERKKLLSFVICGGGPTGVEVAAEIFDLINEDMPRLYPKLLRQEVSVHVIQSRSHILNTYDQTISEYAMKRFERDNIDLLINSRVEEILPDKVLFTQKQKDGKTVSKEVSYGLCLWSTGVGKNPLTSQIANDLQGHQMNKRALETDSHLRVIGTPLGDVYAIGDCSTVRTDIADHCEDFIRQYLIAHHKSETGNRLIITDDDLHDCKLSFPELRELCKDIAKKNPLAREGLALAEELAPGYDQTNSGFLNFKCIKKLLQEVNTKVTALPATAQRAHQEGEYLGKKLHKLATIADTLVENDINKGDIDDAIYRPFKYTHLGSLAYIGNSAVFDLPGYSFFGGLIAMYLWRSIYFTQSVSMRTRALLFFDWLKRGLFGRDLLSL